MKKEPKLFWLNSETPVKGPFHYATMNSFYTSPPWRRLRGLKLAEDPFCERCLERGITVPAVDVHHIQEIALRPELALEYTNLESLCKTCHGSETASKGRKATKGAIYNYALKNIDKRNP